jgi:predicted metal-dependent hydrolase
MIVSVSRDQRSFQYGQKAIDYNLHLSRRKTLEISVYPDQTVVVKAPVDSEISSVEKRLKKRAGWICRQLEYFRQFELKPLPKSFINGETHLYLGRQYRLKIAQGNEDVVKLVRGKFLVSCREEVKPEKIRVLLENWYFEKSLIHFNASLSRCWHRFRSFGLKKPAIVVRRMQKRWGSLSSKGVINLNPELIKASKECIDYVVTHELCHLEHHDHSPAFYKLLASILPDWQSIKDKLEMSQTR